MPKLQAGDAFPADVAFNHIPASGTCDLKACGTPQPYNASQEFARQKVVLVAVPGAFTPTCQAAHLPSFLESRAALEAKGVERVVVIACNDPFVMVAWAKANGVADDFMIFASDADLKFSKSIDRTLGDRTARYAIVVDHGKVVYVGQDDKAGSIDNSGAKAVLAHL